MNHQIRKALEACVHTYSEIGGFSANGLLDRLVEVFESETPYLDKVARLDAAFDDHSQFEELREVVFDLLLMNFFAADVEKLEEDYLESEEWETIEDQTIDRGTEILNLLLYLRECVDEDIEPQLADYLKEFLLVDEDEFQDEYRIYEPVIANQVLVDSSYEEIAKVASKVPGDHELNELFYPLLGFFHNQQPSERDLEGYTRFSANPAFETSVYKLLIAYNR